MNCIGIVAEYNPFHTGHRYQLERSREQLGCDAPVIAVMSGNWVQQADCAIADKWLRTRLALMGGADLVLELPTVWALSSAESFARGAVSILNATGVVDHISFGSECGDIHALCTVAACLDCDAFHEHLKEQLTATGSSFPVCRQKAAEKCIGETASLLASPNNNLGIEYIRALHGLGSAITPMTVLRSGAGHNSLSLFDEDTDEKIPSFVSATQIRADMLAGRWQRAEPYLVPGSLPLFGQAPSELPSLERISRAILARVRTMTAEDWAKLPDSGAAEGLPQRLEQAGASCRSISDFFDRAKTKRYTHARLSRLLLWAYLGITADRLPAAPPYLRVLGFRTRGQELLKAMKRSASLPILTKPAHAHTLSDEGRSLFALEAHCTDLYDLCFDPIPHPGREWRTGPVRLL